RWFTILLCGQRVASSKEAEQAGRYVTGADVRQKYRIELDCAWRGSHPVHRCTGASYTYVGLATFHEDAAAIMQAYSDVGMRATVAVSYADRDFYESVPIHLVTDNPPRTTRPRGSVDQMDGLLREYVQQWRGRHPRRQPALGPSSLPRCSEPLFERSV